MEKFNYDEWIKDVREENSSDAFGENLKLLQNKDFINKNVESLAEHVVEVVTEINQWNIAPSIFKSLLENDKIVEAIPYNIKELFLLIERNKDKLKFLEILLNADANGQIAKAIATGITWTYSTFDIWSNVELFKSTLKNKEIVMAVAEKIKVITSLMFINAEEKNLPELFRALLEKEEIVSRITESRDSNTTSNTMTALELITENIAKKSNSVDLFMILLGREQIVRAITRNIEKISELVMKNDPQLFLSLLQNKQIAKAVAEKRQQIITVVTDNIVGIAEAIASKAIDPEQFADFLQKKPVVEAIINNITDITDSILCDDMDENCELFAFLLQNEQIARAVKEEITTITRQVEDIKEESPEYYDKVMKILNGLNQNQMLNEQENDLENAENENNGKLKTFIGVIFAVIGLAATIALGLAGVGLLAVVGAGVATAVCAAFAGSGIYDMYKKEESNETIFMQDKSNVGNGDGEPATSVLDRQEGTKVEDIVDNQPLMQSVDSQEREQ